MANEVKVEHYKGCSPAYPEKQAGEEPRKLIRVDLFDNEYVMQCVDCGAHSGVLEEQKQ